MRKISTLLSLVLIISLGKGFSQPGCVVLGCAKAQTGVITDGSLPNFLVVDGAVDPPGLCFEGNNTKQIFWEFFFSPSGGDFVQGFFETAGGTGTLDLDYNVFDMGTTAPTPAQLTCPISIATWTEVPGQCNFAGSAGLITGPGQGVQAGTNEGNTLTTVTGHYYAIAISMWQGPGNFSFDATAPTLGGNPLTAANCLDIVLPVTLSSFSARVNDCAVNLNWTSEIESDFKDYEVQYSSDGRDFTTIATLPAQSSSKNYSYRQNNPQQGKGYYRLKMVDIDGKSNYSKTIAMKLDCSKSQLLVYPNPVFDVLNINITNSEDNSTRAKLFDANGRLIYSNNMISGTNTINMANLPKGIYLLQLINSTEVQNLKIIK